MRSLSFIGSASLAAIIGATAATAPALAQETIELTLWSRVQGSGPLRAGNIKRAGEILNEQLDTEGADFRVNLTVLEQPAEGGFTGDAERLQRAFAIGQGPDMFITAHELICSFAVNGFALDLTDAIENNPEHFGTIFPSLWPSTECAGGRRFAIPQDTEARMFFFNKNLMREAGFEDEFIDSLRQRVGDGEVSLDDMLDIAKQVMDNADVEFGLFHRPTVGPDYHMIFQQFGNTFIDPESGKILVERDKLVGPYAWFKRGVDLGVIPADMTTLNETFARDKFWGEGAAFFWQKGVWDIRSAAEPRGVSTDREAFFENWDWIATPPAEVGGEPGTLSHPIVYAVAADTEHPDVVLRIIGIASGAELNTEHAVTTSHIAIRPEQLELPRYKQAWELELATDLLQYTAFMPNHPDWSSFNQVIFEALEGVELGRLTPEEAADFVVQQAQSRVPPESLIVR